MKYTPDQLEFLRVGYRQMDLNALTAAFNAAFDTCKFPCQIRSTLKNHKMKSGRTGQFEKGHVTFNKGRKGWQAGGRSVETQFKKGRPAHEARNYLPIGSTRVSKDGYIERKVTDDPSIAPARRWVGEHRLLWEAAHGPIPEGHAVVFLDGDRLNCVLENLRCVHQGVLAHLNQRYHKFGDSEGEARKAGILIAEVIHKANTRAKA